MKKMVILTGAGISAESGLKTFRDSGGLWENYKIEHVATPEAWLKDKNLVLQFYNERRAQVLAVQPNQAHEALAKLESKYDLHIITQNVDDLHERAGSSKVMHLHGEVLKMRSEKNSQQIVGVPNGVISLGDLAPDGGQYRPDIVWFGEEVPLMESASAIVAQADEVWVIGCSLQVYPAAGLVRHARDHVKVIYIDPNAVKVNGPNITVIKEKAGSVVPAMVEEYLNNG
ncbi:MAG: NAD-dependent protein deacylase [Bacteroidota bacterium]|jgi:NAD-dependent deacetylase